MDVRQVFFTPDAALGGKLPREDGDFLALARPATIGLRIGEGPRSGIDLERTGRWSRRGGDMDRSRNIRKRDLDFLPLHRAGNMIGLPGSILREGGVSSTPRVLGLIMGSSEYRIIRRSLSSGAHSRDRVADDDNSTHLRNLATHCARVLQIHSPQRKRAQVLPQEGSREDRVRAAPAVSRAKAVKKRTRAYRFSGSSPAFLARWCYGLLRALPGDRAFLPPSPLRSLLLKNLTPASRCQDHTTSPSALARRSSAPKARQRRRVHRIPCPTFKTIMIRPF
jgi:hypothetical protein